MQIYKAKYFMIQYIKLIKCHLLIRLIRFDLL